MCFTNQTKQLMNFLYKKYLENNQTSSSEDASNFPAPKNVDEISNSLEELADYGYIELYNDYSFCLTPTFIAHMESIF